MWYIEMHHIRTFFMCGVMTFSYYVMFIVQCLQHLQKESLLPFLMCCIHLHVKSCSEFVLIIFYLQLITVVMFTVLWQTKSKVSFSLEDSHVVNKLHVNQMGVGG